MIKPRRSNPYCGLYGDPSTGSVLYIKVSQINIFSSAMLFSSWDGRKQGKALAERSLLANQVSVFEISVADYRVHNRHLADISCYLVSGNQIGGHVLVVCSASLCLFVGSVRARVFST